MASDCKGLRFHQDRHEGMTTASVISLCIVLLCQMRTHFLVLPVFVHQNCHTMKPDVLSTVKTAQVYLYVREGICLGQIHVVVSSFHNNCPNFQRYCEKQISEIKHN